jgi:hypothetical protein
VNPMEKGACMKISKAKHSVTAAALMTVIGLSVHNGRAQQFRPTTRAREPLCRA